MLWVQFFVSQLQRLQRTVSCLLLLLCCLLRSLRPQHCAAVRRCGAHRQAVLLCILCCRRCCCCCCCRHVGFGPAYRATREGNSSQIKRAHSSSIPPCILAFSQNSRGASAVVTHMRRQGVSNRLPCQLSTSVYAMITAHNSMTHALRLHRDVRRQVS